MRTLRFLLVILCAGLLGYYVGVNKITLAWKNYHPQVTIVNKEPPPGVSTADFSKFWVVMQKLQDSYYDPKAFNAQKIVNGAISGMVGSLDDPYTVYLPPQQNDDFKQTLAGKFEGIGAELGMNGKQIIVVAPLDGSPAQKAGIKPGDAIVKVDDKQTFGWTINQAVDKIRGVKGTNVNLTVVHKDTTKLVDVPIMRDTIQMKSISSWTKKIKDIDQVNKKGALKPYVDQKVAYVRLSQFGDTANKEWLSIANEIGQKVREDKDIKGVVFDLRNNPGGYLSDAVFISSEFLKSGSTVVIQDDGKGSQIKMDVNRQGILLDVPLVILINKGSASASEIVSGAIRDNKRGLLVGETSFGKGTIQQAEDLGEGAGIHITIAKWLTPNQTWVHGKGLTPDVEAKVDEKDPSHDNQLEKAIETVLK